MIKGYQIVPYSSLFIDMQYRHLFNTLQTYLKPLDQNKYLRKQCCARSSILHIEEIWLRRLKNQKLQSLYVLVLLQIQFYNIKAINLSLGSEVIITGIYIPNMIQIIRLNIIIPVEVMHIKKVSVFYIQNQRNNDFISFLRKFDTSEIIDQVKSKGLFIMWKMKLRVLQFLIQNQIQMLIFLLFFVGLLKLVPFLVDLQVYIRNNEVYLKNESLVRIISKRVSKKLYQKDFNKFNTYEIVKYQKNKQKFKMGLYQYFSKLKLQRICCKQHKWFSKE
ncbi:unnamed protein product [Paramecium primaurelia]|uniref:Transmembrane protein n=1 Tax=Paramecium primaurelia TaxID=5886 RepID=A0A8S1PH00_PARPR|nr:unnamed protein product [Paramecium primaurelia]